MRNDENKINALMKFYPFEEEFGKQIIRCVVTEDSNPYWYHLDKNTENNNLGNLIPLNVKIIRYLNEEGKINFKSDDNQYYKTIKPIVLINKISNDHIQNWQFGRAIGCMRLALYLKLQEDHKKILNHNLNTMEIACKPIRHLRHHVDYEILETTLKDILIILQELKSIEFSTLINLKYDLVALLNEHGEFEKASICANELAKDIKNKLFKDVICKFTPDNLGSIKRRIYQVSLIEKQKYTSKEMESKIQDITNISLKLNISLANTQVLSALESRKNNEIKEAYKNISSLCEDFDYNIMKFIQIGIGPSDLPEIFLYNAILATILKPNKYHNIVKRSCDLSEKYFKYCHAKITYQYPDFWINVFRYMCIDPRSDHPLSRLIRKHNRMGLPETIKGNITKIFKDLKNKIIIPS